MRENASRRSMLLLLIAMECLLLTGAEPRPCAKSASDCNIWPNCTGTLSMDCGSDEHVFIVRMLHGFKPASSACSKTNNCNGCCHPEKNDCFADFSDFYFNISYTECWNKPNCDTAARTGNADCFGHKGLSKFSLAEYICLKEASTTEFWKNAAVTAPTVAISYNSSASDKYPVDTGLNKTWHCLVDTVDCLQRQTEVLLIKESIYRLDETARCSRMGVNGEPFPPCNLTFQYERFNVTTPFHLSVNVVNNYRFPSGWVMVRAQDGNNVVVTCGQTPDVNKNQLNYPGQGPNIAAVVGGVVAAVVVLVAAVVAVLCFVRRSRLKRQRDAEAANYRKVSEHIILTSASSTTSSTSPQLESGKEERPGQGYSEVSVPVNNRVLKNNAGKMRVTSDDENRMDYNSTGRGCNSANKQAAAPGIHGNLSPVEDPDYNRLGGKKPHSSSSNPATTYGRLGEVGGAGEDTDYSYDHLARGRQAAPDVIDSVYATAGLHMTSEGDYSVADFHKRKLQVITRSDYDVAEVVTSGSDVTDEPSTHIRVGGVMYAVAKPIMTSSGDTDYDEARSMAEPGEESEYSAVWECSNK